MAEPSDWVNALARERAGYLRGGKSHKIAPVDEALAAEGWCVNGEGELVPVSEALQPDEDADRSEPPRRRRPPRKQTA